ncbi:MAG: cellulase family glycosylhydrolase [Defluviitaleaceae bacterium]|nr:cellulase family glycosylhydrolase [Defluviitaleaceae bacterium]
MGANKKITIQGEHFMVDGKRIWINGANTPWNKWNDFGGEYNDAWWNEHFALLHENGLNATRVWVNCNNNQGAVIIDEEGTVSGTSRKHWDDLDLFFAAAERHQIYIMATLTSFDHFQNRNDERPDASRWRKMVLTDEKVDAFVKHYVIPFTLRYKENPYLWSIDLMNEPDWAHEEEYRGNLAWEDLSRYFARAAAAIHENSDVPVTVGLSFPKYHSDGFEGYEDNARYEGDKVSDAFLQSIYPNKNAYIDFYSPHYYDWVGKHYGSPFQVKPFGSPASGGWGLWPPKPAVLGECAANGSAGYTLTEDYQNAFDNGWQGVMPWTSNRVDGCGGFEELKPAINHMRDKYPELVFPLK